MSHTASSYPHALTHAMCHPFPPSPPVPPPRPIQSDWNMTAHSHQGRWEEKRQQLDIPQREHSIERWRNMRKLKTWMVEKRKETLFIHLGLMVCYDDSFVTVHNAYSRLNKPKLYLTVLYTFSSSCSAGAAKVSQTA